MDITRAAGKLGIPGLYVTGDPGAITGLPLAWRVETAKDSESTFAMPLLDAVKSRGFRPEVAIMDMGYDHEAI